MRTTSCRTSPQGDRKPPVRPSGESPTAWPFPSGPVPHISFKAADVLIRSVALLPGLYEQFEPTRAPPHLLARILQQPDARVLSVLEHLWAYPASTPITHRRHSFLNVEDSRAEVSHRGFGDARPRPACGSSASAKKHAPPRTERTSPSPRTRSPVGRAETASASRRFPCFGSRARSCTCYRVLVWQRSGSK